MSRLITIAAWIAAIATVLWQRALKPLILHYFPELFGELAPQPVDPALEPLAALISVSEPAPTPRRTRSRKASGFAAA